ncbi:hypothetical protein OOU_Y34scaffold00665g16 [Pyricularia oryzae Y34]|uniref:Uncharacterized protein n=2 Tax=Pyricularia oryzae TaxID=318829 RepID=A0AA97PJ18_PYRO3|nr:hypothetical protein OOU_Y34scaffold00665g16 [Pyricularia oryzae Y34]
MAGLVDKGFELGLGVGRHGVRVACDGESAGNGWAKPR